MDEAKNDLNLQDYATSTKLVDDVINGCKYLVANTAKSNIGSPTRDFVQMFEWNTRYNEYIIIAAFGILFIIALFYVLKKEKTRQ